MIVYFWCLIFLFNLLIYCLILYCTMASRNDSCSGVRETFYKCINYITCSLPPPPPGKKAMLMAIRQCSSLAGNHIHIHSGTGSMYIPSTYCQFSTVGIYYVYKGSKGWVCHYTPVTQLQHTCQKPHVNNVNDILYLSMSEPALITSSRLQYPHNTEEQLNSYSQKQRNNNGKSMNEY